MAEFERRLIYRVGAFVTNGRDLCEIVDRCDLGSVTLEDVASGERRDIGMDALAHKWWLARSATPGRDDDASTAQSGGT